MKIAVIEHVHFEGPAQIQTWAVDRGHQLSRFSLFDGEALPSVDSAELFIFMGGSMSVNDENEFSWLVQEKALVRELVKLDKLLLGVCLGAQLIASALGARVYPNKEREIGWFPVYPTIQPSLFPSEFLAFHWHGETFDLPATATQLLRSEACDNQAFSVGDRTLGLQFHLEVDAESIGTMLKYASSDIRGGVFEQSPPELLRDPTRFETLKTILYSTLDDFVRDNSSAKT